MNDLWVTLTTPLLTLMMSMVMGGRRIMSYPGNEKLFFLTMVVCESSGSLSMTCVRLCRHLYVSLSYSLLAVQVMSRNVLPMPSTCMGALLLLVALNSSARLNPACSIAMLC